MKEAVLQMIVNVRVQVPDQMTTEEMIDDYQSNCYYTFESTDDVVVLHTELLETRLA